jgi:amino acid permease
MRNPIMIIGEFLHKNFENFTKLFVLTLGFFGILFAIVGHYGTVGFNWKWFFFFELPLYVFCIWALYVAYKLYKKATEIRKKTNAGLQK